MELMLAGGASHAAVGKKFRIGTDAVWRHFHRHMSPERRAQLVAGPLKVHEMAERAAEEGMALLDYLGLARSVLVSQFLAASEAADRQGVALIGGRLLESLRIIAQLSGELTRTTSTTINNTQVNFCMQPAFASFQADLIRVLARFPEARQAVIAEFEKLDAAGAPVLALEHDELAHAAAAS